MLVATTASACDSEVKDLTIDLEAQQDSTQSGTALLTAKGESTEVVLQTNPGPGAGDPQPVHIHFGSCGPNLGKLKAPLTDIVGGRSTTLVDVSLSSLLEGDFAINLHKSYPEIRVYTSCGNLTKRDG